MRWRRGGAMVRRRVANERGWRVRRRYLRRVASPTTSIRRVDRRRGWVRHRRWRGICEFRRRTGRVAVPLAKPNSAFAWRSCVYRANRAAQRRAILHTRRRHRRRGLFVAFWRYRSAMIGERRRWLCSSSLCRRGVRR